MNTAPFYANLASILNTTPQRASALVAEFNTGSIEFFTSYFDSLPTASLVTNNSKNKSVSVTLHVEEDPIGSGGYGVIQKNRTQQFVYKTMKDMYSPEKRIQYLKLLFKEVLIQSLLQSDAKYGKHVCRLYKVYRIANYVVFQLEPLETTINKYFDSLEPEPQQVEITRAVLKLLEIVDYFKSSYGFNHNDLKLDNVMMAQKGNVEANLKLIDFGLSSIKLDNIEIGKPSKMKADMQYLFYSLLSYLEINPTNSFSELIKKLGQLPIETPIQTYINSLRGSQKKPRATRATKVGKPKRSSSKRNRPTRKN